MESATKGGWIIPETVIKARIKEVCQQVKDAWGSHTDYLDILIILKGGFMIGYDVIKELKDAFKLSINFLTASSYNYATKPEGEVVFGGCFPVLASPFLVVVDDICATGNTLQAVRAHYEAFDYDVKCLVMLDCPSQRTVDFMPDYKCFEVEDGFYYGYGLDYRGYLRELPFIKKLEVSL